MKVIYEPLAISTNILQAPHTRLDHVVVTLGNLYSIFSNFSTTNSELQSLANCVCAQIQKRFASTDQDAAIFAVFCNPYLRYSIFSGGSLSCQDVYNMGIRLCHRFWGDLNPSLEFMNVLFDYAQRKGEWSDEAMNLELYKSGASHKVYFETSIIQFDLFVN